MMNGKTYLISFTALFSKKGYELTVGVDTLYDGIKDTQYHLTAPATSTYRAMKLDEAKTADKLPYVATSLFGGALRQATIDTEVEGVEMDAVMASVTDYLATIQEQLSGSKGEEEALIQGANSGNKKQPILDAMLDNKTAASAFDREANRDEEFDTAEHQLSSKNGVVSTALDARNLTSEIKDVIDIETYKAGKRLTDTPDAVIHRAVDSRKLDPDSDGITEYVATRNITSDQMNVLIDRTMDALNKSKEKDAGIESFKEGLNQSTTFDLSSIDRFIAAGGSRDLEADVEDAVAAEAGTNSDATLDETQQADYALSDIGIAPDSLTEAVNGEGLEGKDISFTDVEMIKSSVSDAPEVLSAVRLLNIMYGHEAARTVVAGMSDLIDTLIAQGTKADSAAVTEAVVSKIKGAVNAGSAQTVLGTPERAVSIPSGTGIDMNPERAQSISTSKGQYELPTFATSSPSSEGEMVDIGRAIAEANRNLYLANPNVANSVAFGEGVLGVDEWAESAPTYEAENAIREQAEYIQAYDTLGYDTETAEVLSPALGVTSEPETAVREMNYDAVLSDVPGHGSKDNMYEEAVINLPEHGGKDVITVESVLHETEHADISDRGYESDYPSETETAEPITVKLGTIDNAGASGGADIVIDGRLDAISNMQGDTVYDATISGGESGEVYSGGDAVIYEYSGAGSMDTVADILIEEDTGAELLLVTEDGDVGEGTEATRKKNTYRTEIEEQTESERKRRTHRTAVELDVEAERGKRTIPTAVEEAEEAKRPKKRLPTTIEESEEGTNLTKPEPPKSKIWLIMGKIASWSLWNWKKTR